MKPIVSLSVVAGIALASTAGAQAPSDISPTPGRWAVTYAPTHEAGGPASASASNGAKAMNGITAAVTALNAGGATSPATKQSMPNTVTAGVAQIIQHGSGAAVAQANAALGAAGAPAGQTARLTTALANLSAATSSNAANLVASAAAAFNDLTAGAPHAFIANPPATYLAIHMALHTMLVVIK